jgi:formylglycine-generating enzyme required for sulfatase activity
MTQPTNDKLPRVIRGGSWGHTVPAVVRAANRVTNTPSSRSNIVGFRTALAGRLPR